MAQTGFTPIQLYRSATASAAPVAGNLADGELAINTNDGRLYYKDSGGVVQTIGAKLGTNVAAFLTTPSSANLASAVTNETGTGLLVFNTDPALTKAIITSERETAVSLTGTAIDLTAGNYFYKTISADTTFTITAGTTPASGTAQAFILELTNGGAFTITWFAGLTFVGGTAPTLTAAGRDVLAFFTRDGGTTWSGFVVGKNLLGP